MLPDASFLSASIYLFAILINSQRGVFLSGHANSCAEKLAGQLGTRARLETGMLKLF